ncbi:hypothetical protein V3331_16510 [Gaopeijia maritima]|uniref:energy transducer TonB n=1 Tax=Gaopeijia maritima TaxID=3119007 RepID=UPI003252C2E4
MDAGPDRIDLRNDERRRRERPVWRRALGASIVVHLLIFLSWPSEPVLVSPFSAAGPRNGDDRAAAGSMQTVNMRIPPAVPIVPPPLPTPTVEPVVELEFDDEARVEPSEVMGTGLAELGPPGLETGTGAGDGGTADEGLFRLVPPMPRAMILPTFAEELKERGAEIWVWVDATGRVVPDSTRVEPPTSDRGLNRRLREEAADWRFEPARQGGEAVASWYNYRVRTGG